MVARERTREGSQRGRRVGRAFRWIARLSVVSIALALTMVAIVGVVVVLSRMRLASPDDAGYPVRGIDVSHHQGPIDWQAVAATGIRFAYIKATEGADHIDSRFAENWRAAERAGVVRGAYHFFRFCSAGAAQAKHLIATVPPTAGTLPPAVDVEYAGNCAKPPADTVVLRELEIMLRELEVAYGRRPLLYTTNEVRLTLFWGWQMSNYPVWIRNRYGPPWTLGVSHWTIWQHADDGRLPGIAHAVDLNVFHGDEAAFAQCVSRGECDAPGQRIAAHPSTSS